MSNLNKTVFVLGLAASVVGSGQAMAQAECGSVNLLFNKFVPDSHAFYTGGMLPWAEDVESVTEGRVTVSFTSASLAPPPQQWSMVTDGIADVGLQVNPLESARLHLTNIGGLPLVGNLAEARGVALWRTQQEFFSDAGEYDGVHLLGQFTNAGAGLISSREVHSMDDVAGMKFWTIGGPPAAVVEAIGAVPVPAPGEEMFSMFSRGVVDGIATNWGAMRVWNAYRYTEAYVDIPGGLYAVDFSFIMNQDVWDGICETDQELIMSVSGERIARNVGVEIDEYDIVTQSELPEHEIIVIEPDAEFMAGLEESVAYARDTWMERAAARGVDGEAALAYYLEQVAAVTAEAGN